MDRITLAVTTVLALAAAGCAPQASAPAEAPVQGKARAPVSIDAQLSTDAARVTVRFDASATDVRIELRGTDGLVVTSEAVPVEDATFERGASATIDVDFTPGPGRSHLSVAVTGRFHGNGRLGTVTTFRVGGETAEQRKPLGAAVEGGGERIKVVPGQ